LPKSRFKFFYRFGGRRRRRRSRERKIRKVEEEGRGR